MKNFFTRLFLVICLGVMCLFVTGCSNKYSEEAGVYELYYMSGSFSLDDYDYYTITLKANGNCIVKSKAAGNSTVYEAKATFSIENDKIFIVSEANGAKVTEEYDYIDGEIVMSAEVGSYSFTAKFKRADSTVSTETNSN